MTQDATGDAHAPRDPDAPVFDGPPLSLEEELAAARAEPEPGPDIATVNEIAFPVDVPVNFRITSASVMNSFFIPQLGSQIYSMAGMETKLHLNAREIGTYAGISANYSGGGFSGMRFKAHAMSQEGFDNWIKEAKSAPSALTPEVYAELTKRSEHNPVVKYSSAPPAMFDFILGSTMTKMAGVDSATCTSTSNNLIAGIN